MIEKEDDYLNEVPDEVEGPDLVVITEGYTGNDKDPDSDN